MANTTDWLNISAQSGSSGTTRLTITARRNTSLDSKYATITAYNPVYNVSAKTYVSLESYTPYLAVSPTQLGVPASGGTYELSISGNCEWVIAFPDMVSSYSTSAGTGDTVVTFTIPATQCASTVVANIVVTDETGQISRLCRIEQYAEPISILYNPQSLTFPYYGGPLSFSVSANCIYSIASGEGSWYTFTPTTGTFGETDFTVSAASINSGNTDWTGTINIVGPEGVAAVLMLTQLNQGQYSINYTADTSTIDYSGETRTITIDATDFINSSITVTILDAPDVTYTYQTSGLTRGIITLTIPQNPGGERNFKVVVTGRRAMSQNYSTAAIQYTQAALQLDFVTDTSNVRGSGEVRTITILNSNINPNRTGLNLPASFPRGSYTVSGNVITLTYPVNPSSSASRTWTIGVVAQTNDGVSLSGSYSITQDANSIYSIPYTADTSTVSESGETRIITIDASNLVASSITVGAAGATDVSATYSNGVVTVVFPENTSVERAISITINGETLNGYLANATVNYEQDGDSVITAITLNVDSVTNSGQASVSYAPSSSPVNLVYSSSDTNVATVDNYGNIVVVSEGTTTITVRDTISNLSDSKVVTCYLVDQNTPLTFEITGDGEIVWEARDSSVTKTIQYKKNNGNWTDCTSSTAGTKIYVDAGDIVQFRGDNANYGSGVNDYSSFRTTTCQFKVKGNIMSLLDSTGYTGLTTLASAFTFYRLFDHCSGLTDASNLFLPATTLAERCYSWLFLSCNNLTGAPELPATILAESCYDGMFEDCSSLTTPPVLSATTLADHCYDIMFQSCSALTAAPELPATSLTQYCYAHMFRDCKSLTTPPVLSATTMAYRCYWGMFEGCSGLATTPALPATTLAEECYSAMFSGCTSLTTAPELPATTLAKSCYGSMFARCTNLTTASAISATTVANSCCSYMFSGCTSLTTAPAILPATTLANYCYVNMFIGCRSLSTAPVLPAPTLVSSCYNSMFMGCSSLNYIKCLATDISASQCTYFWVNGVAPTGTFVKDANMTDWTVGNNGIPVGWLDITSIPYTADTSNVNRTGETRTITIDTSHLIASSITIDLGGATGLSYSYYNGVVTLAFSANSGDLRYVTVTVNGVTTDGDAAKAVINYTQFGQPGGQNDYLRFIITSDGNIIWKRSGEYWDFVDIKYRKNNGEWNRIPISGSGPVSCLTVSAGDIVEFKGDNTQFATSNTSYYTFSGTTCGFNLEGNIMSLLNSTGFSTATTLSEDFTFKGLFRNCAGLTDASNLVLPATALTDYCYDELFLFATSLTAAPALPATTLGGYCYRAMFQGCTSLTSAPVLSATTLVDYCYMYMFLNCASLAAAPVLPALTVGIGCYWSMFQGCTSLATAPVLSATTVSLNSYDSMFLGCTSLTTGPSILPAMTAPSYCYAAMFQGCTNLTTAPELPATTLAPACYRAMFSGCTSLTEAPTLPATRLDWQSYNWMFADCSNLNYIKCLATDISATIPSPGPGPETGCTTNWVAGVASAGTFVKDANMTDWTIGDNGIPSGWVVEDYTILPINYTADTSTVASTGETRTITIDTSDLVQNTIGINITGFTGITYTYSNGTITVVFPNNLGSSRSATVTVTAETANHSIGKNAEIEYTQAARIPPQPGLDVPLTFEIGSSGNILWKTTDSSYTKTIQYKKNDGNWTSITSSTEGTSIQVSAGDIVQFRGNNSAYGTVSVPNPITNRFSSTCSLSIYGNIMSLIDSTNFSGLSAFTTSYTFSNLFTNCTGLTDASGLLLPATALTKNCYSGMFQGCTNLVTAPELPAATLERLCYTHMFMNCSSLNYIKCLATDISASSSRSDWVANVASSGTFVTPSSTNWSTGNDGIPSGWTRVDA